MRYLVMLVAGCAVYIGSVALSAPRAADDCGAIEPRRWMAGACALGDIRAALARRMDAPAKAMIADNCAGTAPEHWLPGVWKMGETTVTVAKTGNGYGWKMDRTEGQVSQVWGEKDPAKGEGRVSAIQGCTATLKGAYTAFGGRAASGRNPIGWQMDYTLDLIAPTVLAGEGIGYGQKPFRILFSKQK